MLTAWEKFYVLGVHPFSLTPDVRFAFHSQSHSRALSQVTEALARREGLIVITGEMGTGKTMLCRTLLDTFESRTFLSVIRDPHLSTEDLLRQLLADFGVIARAQTPGAMPAAAATRHQLVTTLHQFLSSLIPLNAHAVVMIDEAQQLHPSVLEEIRLLSNFETDEAKLLQIVLVGQPSLEDILRRPDMRQLNQRVARRCELYPLSPIEVHYYIEHRLHVASGAEGPSVVQFSPAAGNAVAAISKGVPRTINTLCDRALELGFEAQTRVIDDRLVRAAAERLKLPMRRRFSVPGPAWLRVGAPVVLIAAAIGAWWLTARAPEQQTVRPEAAPVEIANAPEPATPAPPPAPAPLPEPAPPPAAPPPDPAPQTVGTGGGYHIAVAAFRTKQRASEVAAAIAAKGLPVATRSDSATGWHQIVVGPFSSADAAEGAQRTLARDGFSETHIAPGPR
jgi:general secretion pathway protein A